jgi:diguanylate cyclase (GGDEF)-like protein
VQLERRWSRPTAGRHRAASIVIFDPDRFGQVNKQYGHEAGDAVLRQVGAILGKRFREGDLIARYGGEEFVAILEGTRANDATRIAESIRATFEATPIDIGTGTPIHVTVSAGCAELGEGDSVTAGLAIADVWLTQAKRAGRNQVIGAATVATEGRSAT